MNDTKERFELISSICNRAIDVWKKTTHGFASPHPSYIDKLSLTMDVEFADQDVGMDLQKLLDFPDGDFFHDMGGIVRHMNRETKKLGDCFMPRCAS